MSRKPGEGYSVRRAATVNDAVEALEQVGRLSHVGYFTIESNTFSSTWSDELFRQFGFTRDAPPRTIDEFTERYHPEDRNHAVRAIFSAFATGQGFETHHRVVWPSGEVRYLWTRATCEVGEGGARRLYGVTQDLTDLRSNEAALLGDLGAYRFLADNTRDLISRCRVDGEITYASPSCKAVTGYRPEELVGGTSYRFIHPDDRDRAFGEMRALFKDRANRDTTRLEYRFWHKEGRWIWLEANPRLVIDASGRVLECVDVARDITQRKLDAEALSAASARADAAAAAKTEFLANMSHELRTPLTSILGFSRLIGSGGGLSETDARHLRLVRESGQMLLSVVNDILDFSRLEAGAVAIAAAPFDLGPFVQDTVEIVRPLAEQKGLRLGFGRVEELRLLGDPARLRQMLLNLLGNAVKFTDAGCVELTTTVSRRADDVTLRLEVRDTGMGIAPDQLTRLFDRFSQVDGSNSRRHGGTGLGLSITKRLCDLMGGRMGVNSRPGAGSTFWFEIDLPMAEAAAPEASRSLSGGLCAAVRVLLAEDHKMNQVLARTLLEGLGCEVDVVENGAEALAAVQRASYDLVLMDMQMPVMDGLQAARAIRELGSDFRAPPIVAMTANVLPEHVALCRQAGMCDHVAKPIDLDELVAVLSRWLPAPPEARAAA